MKNPNRNPDPRLQGMTILSYGDYGSRGKPLDLDVLCGKIAAIRWEGRPMEKGIIAIWRREWRYLFNDLVACTHPHGVNIRRKLVNGYSEEHRVVFITNKLYISKPEQPWLIARINEGHHCHKCGVAHTDVYVWDRNGDEKEVCLACYEELNGGPVGQTPMTRDEVKNEPL